jgi:hypothetical protein
MSDLSATVAIGALFISATFVVFYCTAKINVRSHEILTGVVEGVPLSHRYRTWLLWMTWMPQWAALVAVSVIAASLFIAIAGLGVGDDVRRIAHLCAGAAGFSAFFFLVFGIPHIGLCMSVLREAKGNRSM